LTATPAHATDFLALAALLFEGNPAAEKKIERFFEETTLIFCEEKISLLV
jgi:hypothetical protein